MIRRTKSGQPAASCDACGRVLPSLFGSGKENAAERLPGVMAAYGWTRQGPKGCRCWQCEGEAARARSAGA